MFDEGIHRALILSRWRSVFDKQLWEIPDGYLCRVNTFKFSGNDALADQMEENCRSDHGFETYHYGHITKV